MVIMNKNKFIIFDDLLNYTLIKKILMKNVSELDIKIYKLENINYTIEDTPLIPTDKNLLIEEVEYVRIRVPKGVVQRFNINDMKNYKMTTMEAKTDNDICTADRTLIQLPFENFIELLLEYRNIENVDPTNNKIESIFYYTIANDSIELLDKNSITICYVLQLI